MQSFFQHIFKVRRPLQFALVFFLLSLVMEAFFVSESYDRLLFRRFQERFVREQNELELRLDNFIDMLRTSNVEEVYSRKSKEFRELVADRNISMYVYRGDSLLMWSDNKILETDILPVIAVDHKLVHLSNGWYYAISRQTDEYNIIGLLLIKSNYVIQNKYLENSFNTIFSIPSEVKVRTNTFHQKYVVKNVGGAPAFALIFETPIPLNVLNYIIVIILFLLAFFSAVYAFSKFIKAASGELFKFFNILSFGIILLAIHEVMRTFKFPAYLFNLEIFHPFETESILRFLSPGDLSIVAAIIYLTVYFAYTNVHLRWVREIRNKKLFSVLRIFSLVGLIVYFLAANTLFRKMVLYSNLNFDAFAITGINFSTLFGIISIALLFAVYVFIADYIYRTLFRSLSLVQTIIITLIVCVLVLITVAFFGYNNIWVTALVLLMSLSIVIFMRKVLKKGYKYKHIVLLIIAFSTYSVYVFFQVSNQRQEQDKKQLAVTLSSEHDVVAEYLISENGHRIQFDTTIRRLSLHKVIDYPWLYKYVRKKYFSGYWERYDMQMTICQPEDSVLVQPDLYYLPCLDFFSTLIAVNSERLEGTNFFYLKNNNGRISYFTQINFYSLDEKASLFIQLDSRLNVEDIGYPELLLDQGLQAKSARSNFSYAKYFKGKLSYQSGSFLYNVSSLKYPEDTSEFFSSSFGGYDHFFYKPDAENLIILSKPSIRFFDLMVSFSYLFVFYFLLLNAMLVVASPQWLRPLEVSGFKNRIRISVIGVLLLSLLAVAGTTSYFILEQYRTKHLEAMRDKLQSVYLELENILSNENKLQYTWKSDEYNNLEELLRRLSNIFFTDINLYDAQGRMIASSRPEILDKGISGTLMNPAAFYQLSKNNKAEYRQDEKLGKLQYTSIYTTLVNGQNQFLAYINLPYFTRQRQVVDEISSIMYAIVNFYVILILISISIAVFISEKVTYPLKVIQERFSRIKLGTRNEKIEYEANDEIGGLVAEYNRMVDELEKSVEMLARSEREMAWREMAKQVAHEIKNPLTPMKLSIQQLQRAWNDKHESMNDYFEKVTKTLIEQIDNLSAIATEFSHFAKMPKDKAEKLQLEALIDGIVQLYSLPTIQMKLIYDTSVSYEVWADKDQLSRVFINLISNAIQAIPDEKPGEIVISLEQKRASIVITIKDNGKGIPLEIIDRMFQPNFTTKSSGMGLGLAISKNIIENFGGHITFETISNVGTTFFIEIPAFTM